MPTCKFIYSYHNALSVQCPAVIPYSSGKRKHSWLSFHPITDHVLKNSTKPIRTSISFLLNLWEQPTQSEDYMRITGKKERSLKLTRGTCCCKMSPCQMCVYTRDSNNSFSLLNWAKYMLRISCRNHLIVRHRFVMWDLKTHSFFLFLISYSMRFLSKNISSVTVMKSLWFPNKEIYSMSTQGPYFPPLSDLRLGE